MAALIALTQHLEGARFQAYWQAADACKDVVGPVPGYYEAVRAYILTAITSTCQKASKGMLGESLRLDGPQLDDLVSCSLSLGYHHTWWFTCQLGSWRRGQPERLAHAWLQVTSHRKDGWSEVQAQGGRTVVAFPEMCAQPLKGLPLKPALPAAYLSLKAPGVLIVLADSRAPAEHRESRKASSESLLIMPLPVMHS